MPWRLHAAVSPTLVALQSPRAAHVTRTEEESTLAKGYWVSAYRSVSDPDKLAAYAKLAGPAITGGGGKFLARGEPVAVYEHGLKQRTVIIEFDSVDQAIATHDSPAYQEAVAALGDGAVREIRIIEGV
jgi:uncharacterized protein (DUF1330 family)